MVKSAVTVGACYRKGMKRLLGVSPLALTCAAGLLPLNTAPAQAQTTAESQADSQTETFYVTARRREERLLDVPISITAFSGDRLDNLSAQSLSDIGNFIPNLFYTDRSTLQTDISIRGVGGDARNIGIESGIGLYIDGVYAGRTSAYNIDLADIAQIEILRGPQGTLFGKNTTGGAINITTRRPDDELRGEVRANYGNYDAVRLVGSVSGPLSDTVSGKVLVSTLDRDGYIINQFNNEDVQDEQRRAVLGQLRFQPSSAWDILFSFDYTKDDRNVIQNQLGSDAAFGAGFFNPDRFVINSDQPNTAERELFGFALNAAYELPSEITLRSITGYRQTDILVFSDIDQTPNRVFDSGPFTDEAAQFTQEFQITSAPNQTIEYLAGVYFYRQDAQASRAIRAGGNPIFNTTGPVDTTSYAAFANVTWNATEKLALTGGIRITREKKEGSYTQTSPVPPFNKDFPDLEITATEPSWTVSANYNWTDTLSTYVSVNRGFKSGGFNVDPLATPAPLTNEDITFQPEFVTSFEGGTKASLLDGQLQFAASVFFSKFTDRQVPQFETVGGVPTVITRNAGESEVFGFELELTGKVTPWMSIFTGIGYLDGEYTDFQGANTAGVDFTGNTTERTPQWTINLGTNITIPTGDESQFIITPQFAYVGETFLQPDNAPFNTEDGYALLNLRAGYEIKDGQIGVYAWSRNLTNTTYKVFARQFSGSDQVLFGEPRTYGVEVIARF